MMYAHDVFILLLEEIYTKDKSREVHVTFIILIFILLILLFYFTKHTKFLFNDI